MAFETLAQRKNSKLRLALAALSGGGKTYTALQIAALIGGKKIGVIDSESGSASKYAGLTGIPPFFAENIDEKNLDGYLQKVGEAAAAGVDVLIIDSYSHSWLGAQSQVDAIGGNRFTGGWRTVSPLVTKLVDALLNYPGHVIATFRNKAAYETEKDERGKVVPKKVGLAPVARDGTEYEYDLWLDLDPSGTIAVSKSRCPGIAVGAQFVRADVPKIAGTLTSWLNDGAPLTLFETIADAMRGAITAAALEVAGGLVGANKDKLTPTELGALRQIYAAQKAKLTESAPASAEDY